MPYVLMCYYLITLLFLNTIYMLYVFEVWWMICVYCSHGCEWMGCMYISFMFIFMCGWIKEEVISNTAVGNILGLSVAEGE